MLRLILLLDLDKVDGMCVHVLASLGIEETHLQKQALQALILRDATLMPRANFMRSLTIHGTLLKIDLVG
jgi:hypothetical protein